MKRNLIVQGTPGRFSYRILNIYKILQNANVDDSLYNCK